MVRNSEKLKKTLRKKKKSSGLFRNILRLTKGQEVPTRNGNSKKKQDFRVLNRSLLKVSLIWKFKTRIWTFSDQLSKSYWKCLKINTSCSASAPRRRVQVVTLKRFLNSTKNCRLWIKFVVFPTEAGFSRSNCLRNLFRFHTRRKHRSKEAPRVEKSTQCDLHTTVASPANDCELSLSKLYCNNHIQSSIVFIYFL